MSIYSGESSIVKSLHSLSTDLFQLAIEQVIVTVELDTAKFPSPHELQQIAKRKCVANFTPLTKPMSVFN